jgi:hypothetical protein
MSVRSAFEQLWKVSVGPSAISAFTPNQLTPTQKMILARSRIWGDVIGGNVKAGHRWAKKAWPHEGMMNYFGNSIEDFVFPFELPDEDDIDENNEIDTFRELRTSRRGKILILPPKRPLHQIPKYKAKRYLYTEKIRLEQHKKSGLGKEHRKKN